MTTLVAWLALLCAQVATGPDLSAPTTQPTAMAAPAQVAVARPEGGSALVKTDRISSHAKHGAGPDLLRLADVAFRHPSRSAIVAETSASPTRPSPAPAAYRARAPPTADGPEFFSNIA